MNGLRRMCDFFTTILVAGVLYSGCLTPDPVQAQPVQCADRAANDSSNACANTRFVQRAVTTIPATGVTFLQSGTGAVTVTFDDIFRATWVDPIMFGAACNGADAGPGINRAIAYASTIQATIKAKPCTYNVATPIVDSVGITFKGQTGTVINFSGTGTQIAYRVRNAGNIVNHGAISDVQFVTSNNTDSITAIELEDVSTYNVNNIIIRGDQSDASHLYWGGAGGIGFRTRGREFIRTFNMQISAARPVVVSKNPNSVIDWDYPNYSNIELIANNQPNLEIETGVHFSHAEINNVACVLGTSCIYHNDTTSVATISEGLHISNLGSEQGQSTSGNTIFIHRNNAASLLTNLVVDGFQFWDGQRKGFDITNIAEAEFSGVTYSGTALECIHANNTINSLVWRNSKFASGCSVSLGTLSLVDTTRLVTGYGVGTYAKYTSGVSGPVFPVNFSMLSAGGGTGSFLMPSLATFPNYTFPTLGGTFANSATAPIVLNSTTGVLTCPTCTTSSGGGAITGTAPISVSAAGVVSITSPLPIANGGTNTTTGAVVVIKRQSFCPTGCTTTIAGGGSGTYTPSTGLLYSIFECWGGGGGGGGVTGSVGFNLGGSGGSVGGYSRAIVSAATIGASKAVTMGALGAGGAAGSNPGVAGTATSVGVLCVANGGPGGSFASSVSLPTAPAGPTPGTGDIAASGPSGIVGAYATITTVLAPAGSGASSAIGAGGGGAFGNTSTAAGAAAGGNASGGAGAAANNIAANAAGGNGSPGYVFVTEFTNQ